MYELKGIFKNLKIATVFFAVDIDVRANLTEMVNLSVYLAFFFPPRKACLFSLRMNSVVFSNSILNSPSSPQSPLSDSFCRWFTTKGAKFTYLLYL